MTINEYQQRAMASLNPELKPPGCAYQQRHSLCGESGEAIDIVKKWLAQGHPLDREHLAKELGDVAWHLAEAATALDLDLEGTSSSQPGEAGAPVSGRLFHGKVRGPG